MLPFGKIRIESGFLLLSKRDNTGLWELITSLHYGFAQNFECSLDLPYITRYSPEGNYDGLADGDVKIKYNFYNNDKEAASFMLGYLPGDPAIDSTSTHSNISTMLIYANDIDQFSYNLNFEYTFDADISRATKNDYIIYNASATRPLTDAMKLTGEIQYSRNTNTLVIVGETAIGISYRYDDNLTYDAALGCGLNENSSSSSFICGLTYLVSL